MTVSTTDPIIGRLIDGRYRVRSRIARGGMATVYLATDLRLERRVAIKIMHPHLADDTSFRARFIQEARSAARLAHPNVVNVFDQGQDDDSAYLVMEYLPGITLRELLQEYGSLTPEQTMDIVEALLAGLAAAHKAGIVHRDLKPENVLLADDGRIKIGDFGLARAASANTATGAALLGTIAYLSPELVTRGVADTRSDIYAVGIMMYEMLTGEQPFKGEQPMQIAYQHANDSVPTPSSKNPAVPAELDELVLWATARDPQQRPRDARLLLEQLYETRQLLRTALPTGAIPTQRTKVLPFVAEPTTVLGAGVVAPAAHTDVVSGGTDAFPAGSVGLTDETQVLGPRTARTDTGAQHGAQTAALVLASDRRRARGRWFFALILLLAVLAGGTGWYFGPGPGGHVTVPASIQKQSPDAARATLMRLGFKVPRNGSAYSITVPEGAVADASPRIGSSLERGATVTLLVSAGGRPLAVPKLIGLPKDQAVAAITKSWRYDDPNTVRQFDRATAAGTVLKAFGEDDQPLGAEYPEGQDIHLLLSAGALPSVVGTKVSDAQNALQNLGLAVKIADPVYDDDNGSGLISQQTTANPDGSPLKTGDTITITPSKGPEPVTVPSNLVGKKWSVVKKALSDAGLRPAYNQLADIAPNSFTVTKLSPGEGTSVPKGSTVQVNFSGF